VQDFILGTIEESIRPQLVSLADDLGCQEICTGP